MGHEARGDCSGLITACPGSWGCFSVSSGHWRWCGLPDFSCLSERGGSRVLLFVHQAPAVSIAQEKVNFAVISVPVIKLNVKLCWSS